MAASVTFHHLGYLWGSIKWCLGTSLVSNNNYSFLKHSRKVLSFYHPPSLLEKWWWFCWPFGQIVHWIPKFLIWKGTRLGARSQGKHLSQIQHSSIDSIWYRNACGVSLATRRDSRWTRRHVQKGWHLLLESYGDLPVCFGVTNLASLEGGVRNSCYRRAHRKLLQILLQLMDHLICMDKTLQRLLTCAIPAGLSRSLSYSCQEHGKEKPSQQEEVKTFQSIFSNNPCR